MTNNTPTSETVEMTLGGRTFALSVSLPVLGTIKRITGKNLLKGESPIFDIEPERVADVIAEMAKPFDKTIDVKFVTQHVNRGNFLYVMDVINRTLSCKDEEESENPSTAS